MPPLPSDILHFRFPSFSDSVMQEMQQLRQQERFCDVTVQIDGSAVHGHRVVFAACSPFLRDQFLLDGSRELVVSVSQCPGVGRKLLLSCYTGALEVPAQELVSYLAAASFLRMGHIVEQCTQAVSRYLAPKIEEDSVSIVQQGLTQSEEGMPDCENGQALTDTSDNDMDSDPTYKLETADKDVSVVPSPSPKISLSLINSAVEITRSYLQGYYDDDEVMDSRVSSAAGERHIQGLEYKKTTSLRHGFPIRRRHGMEMMRRNGVQPGVSRREPEIECSYRCPRCETVFQHLGAFMSHVREHKLFLCLRCGKVFTQKSNLTRHSRVHTGYKPFQCSVCHKSFTQNATLQDHLNLHNGIKPHKCNYCDVHFTHKPGLRRHLKELHGKSSVDNSNEIEEVTVGF
ncbi:zinc finger and BTB domain-containing protein 26-like isoform X2 [Rhinatrema bivittatum]|nr:zinc finger and BTB domain-containing protein 26-like isoform X2 [Rhinatrema bivittatum]XP_029433218.1 zinc finger and BTB domain-containing protein 26-like isoform X2 [Rhinatrema bivittatum]XP_029433219.1 zinc finger and BTB domain-containing protein 26-like isoform X2 [Rhinatrema bivittatum]XP_029433220.1 zinc finger and BTB domain-containing protein 26-like isoform X2 [Rhinatrema bivittatum]